MKQRMRPAHVIEIVTPKKFVLNGLWFGPQKPKRVIVWVHGLASSVFSMLHVVENLVDSQTAVLTFNNRGFGTINSVKRKVGKKAKSIVAGAAHEVFTECLDDIEGAINFVRKAGVKNIFLAGHSTGCQKSMYWAHKNGRGVRGLILVAPVSDWAGESMLQGKKKLARIAAEARTLVRSGRKHEQLPKGFITLKHQMFDAQRLLSLYSPQSTEEIFSYSQPNKNPRILKSVKIPTLVLWAQKDEYGNRPAKEIAAWFEQTIAAPHRVIVVPKTGHGFKGGEGMVARAIGDFMKDSRK